MIPLKWMVVLMAVGALMTPVVSAENSCSWLIEGSSDCVKDVDCDVAGAVGIYIWEDCTADSELFTITDNTITIAPDCAYASGNPKVTLTKQLNAEDPASISCDIHASAGDDLKLFFEILNFNEFSPRAVNGTVPTVEVYIEENKDPGLAWQIYYTDDDLDEAEGLTCEPITSENGDIFLLEADEDVDSDNIKTFNLTVKKKLDFEEQVFYKMEYNITSTDERGNQKNTKQTFFIYVVDQPDQQPFWSKIEPVYSLNECRKNETLFTVTAQDRDVDVNYAIKYGMEEAPVGGYFEINETTGVVQRIAPIDREDLLDKDISSFQLTITATEYKPDDTVGEEPNSNQQVTVITIEDCNNKKPEFNKASYEFTIDELTDASQDLVDLIITVTDMDEGDSGSFTLTTSDPDRLGITPDTGKQTADVTLTALWEGNGNNYFNYEVHQNKPLHFNMTATEDANPDHESTASVTITLRDLNDNNPEFDSLPYEKNIKEDTLQGTELLQVKAHDQDVSVNYSTPSIRYNLGSSCYQLEIDNTTGWVTLVIKLDYEDPNIKNEIQCTVTARDEFGEGLSSTSDISISVKDVVDEPPHFQESVNSMSVDENSAKEHEVGRFTVTDADEGAVIDFKVSSECTGSISEVKNVEGWFKVVADTPNYPEHEAIVKVNSSIDREECNEVTLYVMAVDLETVKNTPSDNGTVIITINDVKDKSPEFTGNYSTLDIDEFNENDVPPESRTVFQVMVSDPDDGDTINLFISEPDKNVALELSRTQVTVTADGDGKVATVDVMTKAGTVIDREMQETIDVEITLTNEDEKYSAFKSFKIKINDLNDKTPTMKEELCGQSIHVLEDDGTGSIDGTLVYKIVATDADSESPYNIVTYKLINDELDNFTPFKVDEQTGEVSVFLSGDTRVLDREKDTQWDLQFRASDQCRQPTDLYCNVHSSSPPCTVTVIVDDVNDNDPQDLTWTPDEDIEVSDFLAEDQDLGYILWALDEDVGESAALSYEVLSTVFLETNEEKDLFYAVDEVITDKDSCRLRAVQSFMGANLTGLYNVTLEARDGGDRATNFTFTILVNDGNDHAPYFTFDYCPDAGQPNTIVMAENAYTPGENGQPPSMEVKCSDPNGMQFNIHVKDADAEQENRNVLVKIDTVNSTVVNARNETIQLSYWSLEPEDCKGGCHLKVSHRIDREEGTPYNLSLYVKNTAEPVQESWATLQVVVTNVKEYEPFFCFEGNCSQPIYIYENEPDASHVFMNATDLDNTNLQPDDLEYDKLFYFIKGGDISYFKTTSDGENRIILNNEYLPDGLDREQRQNYSLYILATNDPLGWSVPIDDYTKNNILHLIIYVGDKNDEVPTFVDDVIFSSFMQTDKNGARLTIIKALDADLNETLTYTIQGEQQWIDTGTENPFDGKFKLEPEDDLSVQLTIGFDPKTLTQGYCNFTVLVEDKVQNRDETQVKVYVINEDYQVTAYLNNAKEDVDKKQNEVQHAFSEAYSRDNEYVCVIESITPTQTDSGEALVNVTTIYMHFIDDEKNEPVPKKMILDLTDNANVMTELRDRLEAININLNSVGEYKQPTSEKDVEDTVLTLKILLGVVSLVLGALLVLVISVYCIRTRSLTRKVKVLSTNTFGSKESGLNHMGMDMVPVPGSNLAKVHGNHNPVFTENETFEYKNRDTGSISSGDSVLVGVEDNPEFKSYAAKLGTHTSTQGYENPSYGRSIDEVSAPPPGVQGGMKGNPLLNLGALQDDVSSSNAFGDSDGSEGDAASLDKKMNSNFIFS